MEGAFNDTHIFTDSGECWTLLEYNLSPLPSPSGATAAVASAEANGDVAERDDTDGISVISDCECESVSTSSLEHVCGDERPDDILHLTEQLTDFTSGTENLITTEPEESNYENILSDVSKLKIYVHKRNNKVSSVLNVILLGSVFTAAGMALGYIWGVRDGCSEQSNPSINKILSNLYKFQEDYTFLHSMFKELTLASNFQFQQKKTPGKPKQCKNVFEEPLQSANVVKTTKCMDPNVDSLLPLIQFVKTELNLPPELTDGSTFESAVDDEELITDKKNIKRMYEEKRYWLDKEVTKIMRNENLLAKLQKLRKHKTPLLKSKVDVINKPKDNKESMELGIIQITQSQQDVPVDTKKTIETKNTIPVNIVSYADSLKHDFNRKPSADNKEDVRKMEEWELKTNRPYKKKYSEKYEKMMVDISEDKNPSPSEKQVANKHKYDKPKNDHHKYYRKQKRDNKYKQWEMKGGYLKDYDSVASLKNQENITPIDNNKKQLSPKWDMHLNYMDKFSEFDQNNFNPKPVTSKFKAVTKTEFMLVNKTARDNFNELKKIKLDQLMKNKVKSLEDTMGEDWFDKRSNMRRKARNELEKTMSIDSKLLMNSRWYFRRMNERKQLRAHTADTAQNKNEHRYFK